MIILSENNVLAFLLSVDMNCFSSDSLCEALITASHFPSAFNAEQAASSPNQMAKLLRLLCRRARSFVWKAKRGKQSRGKVEEVKKRRVDLDQISATVHQGCLGLPQELVDHVMDMLCNDPRALKACSLTCKAMFASTRHLIHRTLHLTRPNDQGVLTEEEKLLYWKWTDHNLHLRFLAHMGEHGLLKYTQHVHIRMSRAFVPDTLLPHLHHFQSLDRVHTLTMERHDAALWANDFNTCFVHFYPTLTSLTLRRPFGQHRLLLQFALQFPNLKNLCLESHESHFCPDVTLPVHTYTYPLLGGHLRLAGVDTVLEWPPDLVQKLPKGMNFRSVELENFRWDRAQQVLNTCAPSLESLTIVGDGYHELRNLKFAEIKSLHRFTLRMLSFSISVPERDGLLKTLSTIKSLTFREFVLELDRPLSFFDRPIPEYRRCWEEIDRFLWRRFAKCEGFRFIIRTRRPIKPRELEAFQRRGSGAFPLLAKMGCVHFEMVERSWR